MKPAVVSCGLLVAALLVSLAPAEDRDTLGSQKVVLTGYEHEGRTVRGLRLEAKAEFLPDGHPWADRELALSFTFHNETDAAILLDYYADYYRLNLSRLSPLDAVQVSRSPSGGWKGLPPGPGDIVRVPPRGKCVVETLLPFRWLGCGVSIPGGVSVEGKVVDDKMGQNFKLLRNGPLTLAFLYRSDGHWAESEGLSKFLQPGEQLWSGHVYSNPVTIHVTKLRD